MSTTIQISEELLGKLKVMKMHEKESYENIIWDLMEDRLEFSKDTFKDIDISKEEIKKGQTISLDAIKRKVGV